MRGLLALLIVASACGGDPEPSSDAPPDAEAIDAAVDAAEPDAEVDAPTDPGELRGVWITRFGYADRDDLEGVIDRAAAGGFNAVFVQIRAEADAYYNSAYEPWSRRLTGTLGRTPTWDPLRVAIDRAHGHGMELHAYFNVFTAWPTAGVIPVAEGTKQHVLTQHPEWLAVDSTGTNRDAEYRWLSPGNPAVRAHIVNVVRDLLSKYDVDGLHLDRIRLPGPDYSRDAVSTAAFATAQAANPQLTWADFMRSQVNAMVAEIHDALVELAPTVKFSAAVWGIYQPLTGCSTSQGYGQFYQDSLAWLEAGTMDALVPMVYWSIEPGACTDWSTLVDGFIAANADRHIWAGMLAYDDGEYDFAQIRQRIERSREAGAQGTVIFASNYLDEDPARWSELAAGPYAVPAATPVMPWKPVPIRAAD